MQTKFKCTQSEIIFHCTDCWQISRDKQTGRIIADPSKFPSGMKALGQYIHQHGLKFGLYTDIGTKTCEKRPGSMDYEVLCKKEWPISNTFKTDAATPKVIMG